MKKTILLLGISCTAALLVFQACNKSELPYRDDTLKLPEQVLDYENLNLPIHFSKFSDNNITNHGATLGRVLFYDRKLSVNNKVSCSSCHHQDKAFSDGLASSKGFSDQSTRRNSMAIVNTLSEETFFWDSRSDDLSDMVLLPVQDHIEMGLEELDELETKLAATSYYPTLFQSAFGDATITRARIADAMTQFINSIVSVSSKFDEGMATSHNNFSEDEEAGFNLFWTARCGDCHGGLDFRGSWGEDWANIGLDLVYSDNGLGERIGQNESSNGMFKVPSLRNIALTAPYMHDGRFATLEEVIDHYNEDIQFHDNLDWRLRDFNATGEPIRLNLTEEEQQQLIAFLHTLTDQSITTDERYSNPFEQ